MAKKKKASHKNLKKRGGTGAAPHAAKQPTSDKPAGPGDQDSPPGLLGLIFFDDKLPV